MAEKKSYKIGIIIPNFCDQRYLRDRDKDIEAPSEEDAIAMYKEWAWKNFFNEDEKRAVSRGHIKIGIIQEEKAKHQYPEHILIKLRQSNDLDGDDTSMDDELNQLSPSEVFSEICNWEGLINYSYKIKEWIKDIYGLDIDEMKSNTPS